MKFEMKTREKGCPVCATQFQTGDHMFKRLNMVLDENNAQMIYYVLCRECGMCYLLTYPNQRDWYEWYEIQMNKKKWTYLGDVARSSRIYVDLSGMVESNLMHKVLSFGSGRGYLETYLVDLGVHVMGVDYRQSIWGAFEVIEPEVFMKRNFTPQFDWAFMIHSLEHLVDPIPVLEHIYKALIPGGHLLVEIPSFGHPQSYTMSHPSQYNVYTLQRVMKAAGFEKGGIRQLDVSNDRVPHNTVLNAIFKKPGGEEDENARLLAKA